jgi:spore coat polysaccharide biosynthesis predicted glycosyltransferase SpsG
MGVGHVMRCLVLAEEFVARGAHVVFACDADSVRWAAHQIDVRGFPRVAAVDGPAEHVELLVALKADAVVFDSYRLTTDVYRSVRALGLPTLALVDNELRGAEADLLLDQNIGSEQDEHALPPHCERIAGLRYALLRNDILRLRPPSPPAAKDVEVPRVLAVFGGTDAFGAAPSVAKALVGTGRPFDATLITREDLFEAVRQMPTQPGQQLRPTGATGDLAELVRRSDLVLSAAGSSTWELLALGATVGLVCVADNQATSFSRVVQAGAAVGLGSLKDLRGDGLSQAVRTLHKLLTSSERRAALGAAAWHQVDGRGRARVADRFLSLLDLGSVR